jgi:hypothetical protein
VIEILPICSDVRLWAGSIKLASAEHHSLIIASLVVFPYKWYINLIACIRKPARDLVERRVPAVLERHHLGGKNQFFVVMLCMMQVPDSWIATYVTNSRHSGSV